MKKVSTASIKHFVIALLSILLFNSITVHDVHAEGTRDLTPNAADDNHGVLQIWDNNDPGRNSFTNNAPEKRRLNFTICQPGEIAYFAMAYESGDLSATQGLWYRIMGPSLTAPTFPGDTAQVFPAVAGTWQRVALPGAGAGTIQDWAHAKGPIALVGAANGYTPLSFTPDLPGDYWIEFIRTANTTSPGATTGDGVRTKTRIRFFDLTIYDPGTLSGLTPGIRVGRLWSCAWDVNVNAANFEFNATMFVYSDDGIVTGLNFNRIRPFGFTISCNSTGVVDSNPPNINDRQSVANNFTYAQYKIFLHDPDIDCFPTGIFGALSAPMTVSGCDVNNRCINVSVTKSGDASLLLDLNGVAGYQAGTSDVLISTYLNAGVPNCIPWNGRDGLGNLVTTGTTLNVELNYFTGLTHLPLFDVENHPYGFIVSLVRPAGPAPRLFWDDSKIPGGTVNLAGCATALPTTGCHGFGSVTAGAVPPQSQPSTADWGNNRTINTWWYANIIKSTVPYTVPGSIIVDANTLTPGSGAANDITTCSNSSPVNLNGSVTGGATGALWTAIGGTGTFGSTTSAVTTYTPSAADLSKSFIYLKLTSTGNGVCPAVSDSMRVSFLIGPTITATSVNTCANTNNGASQLGSVVTKTGGGAGTMIWSGGGGTYVPGNTSPTAVYTPTAAEIAAGSVTLTATSTLTNGVCPAATAQTTFKIAAAPTATAGGPYTMCANNGPVTLAGDTTKATGLFWSGGGGTFSNSSLKNSTYAPSTTEKNAAPTSVILTLTAVKAGCTPVTSNATVNITPAPTANAGSNRSICKNDSVNLAGSVTVATTGTWTGGTGTFRPNRNSLTANYKPSAAEIASGANIILTLTTTGTPTCIPASSSMTITLTPAPTVDAGADKTVCANDSVVTLTGNITVAPTMLWIGNGGIITPNTTASTIQYAPSAAEVASGFTGVIVQTTGGSCPPVQDTVFITINPAPTIDAGAPVSICENNPTGTVTGTVTGTSTVTWSSPTGGLFGTPGALSTSYTLTAADIAATNVTLTLTATKAQCLPVSDKVVVTVTKPPIVSAGPARSACRNNPTATLNGSFSGSTGVQWSGGDGTFSAPTSATTNYTAGPNDLLAGSVTLTLSSTGMGNCAVVQSTTTITFTPAPVITSPAAYSVCSNNAVVALTGNSATIATGATWTGGAGSFSPSRNVFNPTYTPTAAEIAAGTLNLTLNTTGSGNCTEVSKVATITFTPRPTVTPATPALVCADNPVISLSTTETVATGVTWAGGAGTYANANALSTTYTPTLTEINTGSVTFTVTTTNNGNCSPVFANVTGTIRPAPTISAGGNQTVCGTVATVVNLNATSTGATGQTWSIVSGSGTISNPNSLSTTYTPSNADIITGSVKLKIVSSGSGVCLPVQDQMTITFTPEPSLNAGPNQIVCSTELPINLNASGSPAVWSTTGRTGTFGNVNSHSTTYTPSAAEISSGSVTLSISTIASGACPVKTSSLVVTIPPGPVVNPGSNATMCGAATFHQLAGSVSGDASAGLWTTDGTGSFTPNANDLNARYVPSAADRTKGSVVITLTSVGGTFCLPISRSFTLTITPAIVVSAGPPQTVCGDVGGIQLNGTVNNAGGATWSIVGAGSGTFGNANVLNTTYTPSPADITAGTVTLRLSSTGNGSCPAITSDVTFTITPAPTLVLGSNPTICLDSAYVQLNATINTAATGVKWTITSGSGTFSPDDISLNSRYTPSAADRANGTVQLLATTTGNGTCNAISRPFTITIAGQVLLDLGPPQTVCENNKVVTLNASHPGSLSVDWTSNGTGVFANPNAASTTYTPSAADVSSGVVTLTAVTTGNGTCKGKTAQLVVTIKPAPIVNAGLPQTVCATSIVTLNGSVTHAGGGTWSGGAGGVFGNANALSTTYTPSAADTTAGSALLTLTSTGNGTCTPVPSTVLITFEKLPVVNAGPNQTICADSNYVQLHGIVANAGGGTWTRSGSGVFLPSATNLNATYSLTATDKTSSPITLTLTSTSNGTCPAVTSSMTVTVTKAPTVSVGNDQTVCANNAVVSVSGSFTIASGIQWTTSGTGTFATSTTNTSVTYTPSALDKAAGTVVLGMTTTGNGTCKPANDFLTIFIKPTPIVVAGADKTICADSVGVLLNNATVTNATGLQWSTNGSGVFGANNTVTQPTYYPSAADKTSGTVRLIALATGGYSTCLPVQDTIFIFITPAPTVTAGSDIAVCADTNGVQINGNSTVAGGVKWTSSGTGIFAPSSTIKNPTYIPSNADTTARKVTLKIITTNNGTCRPVADSMIITIAPKPVISAGNDRTVCDDVDQLILDGSIANATGVVWSTNGSGTFDPNATTVKPVYTPTNNDFTAGTVTFTVTSTGNGNCRPVSDNVIVTFNPVPTASAGPDLDVCDQDATVNVNGSETNAGSRTWVILSGAGSLSSPNTLNTTYNVDPSDVLAGAPPVILKLIVNGLSGCGSVESQMKITFSSAPPIEAGPSKTICTTDFPIQLEATGSTAQWAGYTGTFSPNDQTLNALYTPSAGEIGAGFVTLTINTVSANAGACGNNSDNVTYTFINGPLVDAGTLPNICTNTPTVNLTGSTNGISTGVIWSSAGSGSFTNGTTTTPTYTPSNADKNAGIAILTITSTGNNPACKPAVDTVHLHIQPQPQIVVGPDQILCGDASVANINAFFNNATGVQWTRGATASGSFANSTSPSTQYNIVSADTTAGSVFVTATTTGHNPNCPAVSKNVTLTFTDIPTVNAGNPKIVCADTTSVPVSGKIGIATGGIWSGGTGSFSPSASTTGSISNTTYIPTAQDTLAGSVLLTLTTTGNGSCNAYSSNVLITFNSSPTLTATAPNDSACSTSTIPVSASFNNAANVNWTSTGDGTFSALSGTSSVYTPSANDISKGGVILMAKTTGSNPCKEITRYIPINIVILPSASANAGLDQVVCVDGAFVQLTGTVAGAALGGYWTPSTKRGDFFPDTTALDPIYLLDVNDVPADSSITSTSLDLSLTPIYNGVCSILPDTMKLTIMPVPFIRNVFDITACADTVSVQLHASAVNATGGVWSTTGTGTFSPSAATPGAVYAPSAQDRQNGVVGLTFTTSGNGTCGAVAKGMNLILSPTPTIDIGTDPTVCADSPLNLNAVVSGATDVVTWNRSGTGFFTTPNPTLSTDYIMSNADTTGKVFNIFATVRRGICKPVSDTILVTAQPTPIVLVSADPNVCADVNAVPVSATAYNAGGLSWMTSGSGTFTPDANSNAVNYKPSSADNAAGTVTLTATSTNSGVCSPKSADIIVSIAPIPVVSAGSPIICDTLAGAVLTGTSSTGAGIWTSSSGAGVFSVNNATLNATYVPGHADIVAGQVTLTLTSDNNGTCNAVPSTAVLLIEPLPVANAGQDQFVCVGGQVTVKAETIEPGVVYSWIDNTGTTVRTATSYSYAPTPPGSYMVLNARNAKGCNTNDTVNASTFTLPTFTITPNVPTCYSENLVLQSNPVPVPTVPGVYQWFNSGAIMTGQNKTFVVVPDTGTYTIQFSYGSDIFCTAKASRRVNPVPTINTSDVVSCPQNDAILSASTPDGNTFAWSLNGAPVGTGSPITVPVVANDTIKYMVTTTITATGCSNTDSAYVIGLPNPLMVSLDSASCQGLTVRLTARPTNIPDLDDLLQVSFDWKKNAGATFSVDSTVIVTDAMGVGQYVGTVTIDQCIGVSTNNIDFKPNPVSTLVDNIKYCIDDSLKVTLDAGALSPVTYLWSTLETTQTIQVQPDKDSTYYVILRTPDNCTTRDSARVRLICPPRITAPTGFTPGIAGDNSGFRGYGKYEENYKLMVFNRWGEIIFITHNKNEMWDGTYRGEPMPSGVYPWVITYEGKEEYKGPYKLVGQITLIR